MKLLITDRSPFARKCRAAAHAKGLLNRLELQEMDLFARPEEVRKINPLGKIPALILDDGRAMIDSPVICEYFDSAGGGGALIPPGGEARFRTLHLEALADGMLDSAVEIVLEERRPPEKQYDLWFSKHKGNILRGAKTLQDAHLEELSAGDLDMGKLTAAVALDYVTHRLDGIGHGVDWRKQAPELAPWLKEWLEHPSLKASAPREW